MSVLRLSPIILVLIGCVSAAELQYPLWDGHESVADYAKHVNLPPTKTLDLGNGVKMELVLIPAGKFVMGTPEPVPVDEEGFRKKIVTGQVLLTVCGGALLVMLCIIIVIAIRKRQRPKYSLLWLLVTTVISGGCILGGLHWRQSVKNLAKAQAEYPAANGRFRSSMPYERPAHTVTLTKPFYVGKFAVTQEQYQQITGKNPSYFIGKDNPVEQVSWEAATEFSKKVMAKANQAVRLPTEAEWEYICRAGTTTKYHSGDKETDLARTDWYMANSNGSTHPVGQKVPNEFGLFDLHGNVGQLCQDWYGENYYSKSAELDPEGPTSGIFRVRRGGSWANAPQLCGSAFRGAVGLNHFSNGWGFRVVVLAFRTQ